MELFENMAQTFPLMRGGGVFFVFVGLGIALGALLGKRRILPALIAGGVLAILSQALLSKLLFAGLGRPTLLHYVAIAIGLAVEMALVTLVVSKIPDRKSRQFWLWMLWVVGVHLVIFGFSHGPLSALLGLFCIINATGGLLLPTLEYRWVWLVDGLLKIAIGSLMVWFTF